MLLNKKQKLYLATEILGAREMVKIFETDSVEWLVKQKIIIREPDSYGWRALVVNGEEYTKLNFDYYKEWDEVLNNIDDYEQCEWCKEWFHKDEIKKYKGFKVCDRCQGALWSRGV